MLYLEYKSGKGGSRLNFDNRNNSTSQVIRAIIKLKKLTITQFAEQLGTSRQNLNKKLLKGNFTENDLVEIGRALGYKVVISWEEL